MPPMAESETASAQPTRRLQPAAEDLAWLGAIVALGILAVAFLLLVPPLSDLYPKPGYHLFAVWRSAIAPEPREEIRSMLALGAPIVIAGLVAVRGGRGAPRSRFDPLVVGAQVVAAAMIVVAVLSQPRRSGFFPLDYFEPYLLSGRNLVVGTVIGVALTVAALRWRGGSGWARATRDRLHGHGWLPVAIAAAVTAIWVLPALVTDATVGQAGQLAAGHIPVQAEDYFAVVNGRTPLVDYISQYSNLLPLLLEPVLRTFDSSITSLSVAMCVLTSLGLFAIFGVFREVTRSAWSGLILYVPFVALALFPWNDSGPYRNFDGNYYGVLPGRFVGPFLLAWLCALSTRRRIPVWILFGVAGLVLVNNFEFGIGALLALIAAQLVAGDGHEPFRERAGRIALEGGAGFLAAVVLVSVVILLRTGELPDPALLTYFNRVFLREAYGLVPMHSLGLHWALYATYAAAVLIAAVRAVRDEPNRTLTAMLAFSGVFGLVTGMYFVGRSSQFQLMLLFPAWGLALALVALTAAGSLLGARENRTRLRRLLIPAAAALIGFGVMVASIDRLPPPWRQIDRLSAGGEAVNDQPEAQAYVEANTTPGQKVLIIGTSMDHRLAERAGVENLSPLNGTTSLFSPAEADRALDQLDDAGGDTVFESVSGRPSGGLFFGVPELAGILRARGFRLVGEDPRSGLRYWRRGS